jgi:O-antigen/teichoic acid export membrane protein
LKASHLIAFNTIVSYGQSLVGLVVGLFSARWVLQSLGQTDFGLFGVVGSLILLLTFLNGGLSVGVARFYAFSIGRAGAGQLGDGVEDLKQWFNTALSTHLTLGIFVVLLGWPAGEFAIRHWLNIPADRVEACVTVFHVSIFAGFFSVVGVPYTAMFAAQQRIAELALFGMGQSLLILGLAWLLLTADGDRLVFYGVGMSLISILFILVQTLRATFKFKACRASIAHFFNPGYFKQLFSFVGWKMFGMSCVAFRDQGIPIMTNLMFGPVVNAAYSVANRLNVQANALSASLLGAFQPAITAAEGKGERDIMLAMSLRVCRIGTLLTLIFVVPLVLEMHTLLRLWLQTPPQYAAEIGQWLLAMLIVDRMTAGPMLAVNAVGKIALYELIQGPTLFLALPIMWLLVSAQMGPVSIGIALFVSTSIYCGSRLWLGKTLTNFPIKQWLGSVGLPVVFTTLVGFGVGCGIVFLVEPGMRRLVLTTLCVVTTMTLVGAFLLVNKEERHFVFESALKTRFCLVRNP